MKKFVLVSYWLIASQARNFSHTSNHSAGTYSACPPTLAMAITPPPLCSPGSAGINYFLFSSTVACKLVSSPTAPNMKVATRQVVGLHQQTTMMAHWNQKYALGCRPTQGRTPGGAFNMRYQKSGCRVPHPEDRINIWFDCMQRIWFFSWCLEPGCGEPINQR